MSIKIKSSQHSMQGVFVFVLLGLFAMMSTLMVLLGAQMYRSTVNRSMDNNADRVLGAYVRSMVRAEDADQAVSVEEHGGVTAIALRETIGDTEYVTWLYEYEGELFEQFTEAEYDFDPNGGTLICRANSFRPELEGGLLTVTMTNGRDEECVVQVALRCAQQREAPTVE